MMNRRAQAALEFLMTYGWAILVVLIVIGALSYFGVLNPTILLPEKCTLQMGMYCKNHVIFDDNRIYFELENGMGKGLILTSINVSGEIIDCGTDFTNGTCPGNNEWNDCFNSKKGLHINNGRSRIVNMTNATSFYTHCSTMKRIGKTKAEITIKWYFDDATELFTHTMKGEIMGVVETR